MTNTIKSKFPKGFTLTEVIITMVISSVIFLLLGYVFIQSNSYYAEQFIREHVINYGNMALTEFNTLFKQADNISISNLQGVSRIRFEYPDNTVDVVHVTKDDGFFINDEPMIGKNSLFGASRVNYFHYDKENIIEYKIKDFDCDHVPASLGLFGKLTQTMYRIHLTIEVIKRVNGSEVATDFEFKKDIFAVKEYLS